MKVRKASNTALRCAGRHELQWGRTREGAEGLALAWHLIRLDASLQWGRTREGAEG